jgi:hypothetical protein
MRSASSFGVLLVGVRPLRALGHSDHAAPDRARTILEDALEGQVGHGIRCVVLLRGVEIEMPLLVDDVDPGQPTGRALTGQTRLHAGLARLGTDRARRPVERGVLGDLGSMMREVQGLVVALLEDDVRQMRCGRERHLGDAIRIARTPRQVLLDQRRRRPLLEDDGKAPPLCRARRGDLVGDVER